MYAYIAELQRRAAEAQELARLAPTPAEKVASLRREKHERWFAAMPDAAKHRHWSMEELSAALGIAPRELSQTLLDAGWLRKRVWLERSKGRGRYLRVWEPPSDYVQPLKQ